MCLEVNKQESSYGIILAVHSFILDADLYYDHIQNGECVLLLLSSTLPVENCVVTFEGSSRFDNGSVGLFYTMIAVLIVVVLIVIILVIVCVLLSKKSKKVKLQKTNQAYVYCSLMLYNYRNIKHNNAPNAINNEATKAVKI